MKEPSSDPLAKPAVTPVTPGKAPPSPPPAIEHGGPKGLEPTRYGDWEKNGRCFDF